MNDFWRSVVTGAAVGAGAYALSEAFGRDPGPDIRSLSAPTVVRVVMTTTPGPSGRA